MVKNIEKKINKLVENSDPQELEDKFVEYTIEAMDDVLNGNKQEGKKNLNTSIKFFQDHKHSHPNTFSRASKRINKHLFEIISNSLEDTILSNQQMKLFMNVAAIADLMSLNYINELIISYLEDKNESYLKTAHDHIKDLIKSKITRLDNEIFSEALAEFKKITQEDPEFDEKLHEELVKDVKKSIEDYDSKME